MDLQRIVAVWKALHPDGIVKVAGGLAIDGYDGQVAEVAPARQLGLWNHLLDRPRLVDHGLRKPVRDVMLADHDFDVDAEIVFMAEDLNDASGRVSSTFRKLEDLDIDDHVVHLFDGLHVNHFRDTDPIQILFDGGDLHGLDDIDPSRQFLIERCHVAAVPSDVKLAHDGRMGALQHLDDFAIAPASSVDASNAHHHHVAMHGLQGGFPGNVDVIDERVAVFVDAQGSDHEFARQFRHHKMSRFCFDQIAARCHPVQRVFQKIALTAVRAQFFD